MDNLLHMSADAPASEAFKALWCLGFDTRFPVDGNQPASEWLAGLELSTSQWKKIYLTAIERAQEGQTV